ncbi:acyl-CoA/acyl-ACP dehydrogenase [Waterburya agarophytonicola K14]|uniref:Acyl-CoA/acyl-ACP dehydrogenase n=1 Tax=Waterburya agarophytonicola KI4 TaxID=2874699 RepID=A0A964FFC8_9CYAN|nr:acyl-CoA dehydrogenase family protein [Waterburya agarophytonicola]MCC0177625.1 acyl-CoA/acyl-ACP dehydrogenase [Waterburya agarophytonicola KI4]
MEDWLHTNLAIESWLKKEIKPFANEIDRSPQALAKALQGMSDRSLLTLKVSQKLSGRGLSELEYRRLQIKLARFSGALTFLQTQHQSAAIMLANSENTSLQQKYLPYMGTGKILIGVGFSHLRRQGIPMVSAKETTQGYEITGEVPWITGYSFFSSFILGATLPDGREIYGILPLQNQLQDRGGGISISPPMDLMAIASTNTVSAKIDRWWMDSSQVVSIKPTGSIHQSSRRNILNHGWYSIGCAYAGLDILLSLAEKKQLGFLHESWQTLNLAVKQSEERAIALISQKTTSYEQKLQLRRDVVNLAQRCSQAAVIASGGAANYFNSSAARVYREALLFSVSGQTTDVMEVSLKKLLMFDSG